MESKAKKAALAFVKEREDSLIVLIKNDNYRKLSHLAIEECINNIDATIKEYG